jgi:hypothetical protein
MSLPWTSLVLSFMVLTFPGHLLWLLIISEWCSSLDTELRCNHRAKILLAFFRHLEAGNNRKPYTLNLVTTLRGFFTSPVLYLRLPPTNLATKRNKPKKKPCHMCGRKASATPAAKVSKSLLPGSTKRNIPRHRNLPPGSTEHKDQGVDIRRITGRTRL